MPETAAGPPRPPSAVRRLPRALYERFRHLLHELGKFGTVGAVAFGVDAAIYAYLIGPRDLEPLTAKTISTVLAATVAFVGNRFWTWRHRERSSLAREYGLYFSFNAIGLAIGLAVLWASHYWLGGIWPAVFGTTLADLVAGTIVGNALGSVFRFWSYRRFVFVEQQTPATTPQVLAPATDSSGNG
ncbi:MAG TPA: GtrA family protein [Pilimelia sp.]|nr:GtrA family protein [Pilimelia sp.]